MTMDRIDYVKQELSRIAMQYKERPKFEAAITAVMQQFNDVEAAFFQLYGIVDIETATGVNLDNIGDIVGVTRSVPDGLQLAFFGFTDTPEALPYGEEGVANIGGRFYEEGEPFTSTTVLGDPEFRLLIRAKIVKNHSKGSVEDIIAGLVYMFNVPGTPVVPHPLQPGEVPTGPNYIAVDDLGGMKINIGIGRPLSYLEKQLISQYDLLPRPAGVQIYIKTNYDSNGYFGFLGQPGAKGFGEVGDPTVGGVFAEKF